MIKLENATKVKDRNGIGTKCAFVITAPNFVQPIKFDIACRNVAGYVDL